MRCKPLDYCCDIAILLAYYKIKDDISDGFSPKSGAFDSVPQDCKKGNEASKVCGGKHKSPI